VFHLVLLRQTVISIILCLTVYQILLVIVDEKFFCRAGSPDACMPSVRYGKTFLEAGWEQAEVFLAALEEHTKGLLLGGHLHDAACQQLIELK